VELRISMIFGSVCLLILSGVPDIITTAIISVYTPKSMACSYSTLGW